MKITETLRKPLWAALIFTLCAVWLLSGILGGGGDDEQASVASRAEAQDDMVVRVRTSRASEQSRTLTLRGRTRTRHAVTVRAETSGRVDSRPIDIGARVSAGDVLCQVEINDRELRVREAGDAVELATLEYEGMKTLRDQGLQQEIAVARAKAQLSSARRQLLASELELKNTAVVAPFAGFVEETHAEVGDYLQMGSPCATVLDLDPIYVEAAVTEQQYPQLRAGAEVDVTMATGATARGSLAFIGKQSADESRTYPIEVTVPNPDFAISSGLSAEIIVALSAQPAHKVSMSYVVLDANGEMGVRTVDDDQRVRFYRIDVVREDAEGLWVSGLPTEVTLITVGQEFVSPGQQVKVQRDTAT
ncbi:MAG: efflux RND transporter periplasmic adaptor subunit [Gammaproteobacteria bacterium]|nr:efflux RND transporter periplasmic adaptor subunit [Gammaproteobacteria bacterium]